MILRFTLDVIAGCNCMPLIRRRRAYCIIVVLAFALLAITVSAQTQPDQSQPSQTQSPYSGYIIEEKPHRPYSFGGYLLSGYNYHNANFQKIPGYPNCCPQFSSGKAVGAAIGLTAEYKLNDLLWLSGRIGYETLGAALTAREQSISTTITTPTGSEQARIDHTITSQLDVLSAEPGIGIEAIGKLSVFASFPIGFTAVSTFDQIEKLADDQAGVFSPSGLRTRNEFSKQRIPEASQMFVAAALGVRYELPIDAKKQWLIAPELRAAYIFTKVTPVVEWSISTVRAGVSIRYSPLVPPTMRYDTTLYQDTITAHSYDITKLQYELVHDSTSTSEREMANNTVLVHTEIFRTVKKTIPEKRPYFLEPSLKIFAVEPDAKEKDIATVKVEEIIGYSIHPLLPYVFFEENSDSIPGRYSLLRSGNTSEFGVNDLRTFTALEIYHNVLNVIAKRMFEHPSAVLTITGCNSDLGAEKSNTALSKRRAERVKEYFEKVWNVEAKRLRIAARNLPAVASSAKSQDGIDENRRVEITCTNAEVMRNVILLDTILRTQSVSEVRFYPTVRSSLGIKEWSVSAELSDSTSKLMRNTGPPPERLEWDINKDLKHAPRDLKNIKVRFSTRDKSDSTAVLEKTFPIEIITKQDREKVNNKYVDKYSLILYEFGSFNHTSAHLAMLKYIREHSTPQSSFVVSGHTDRSGSAEYNMMLSTRRAEYTAKALNLPLTVAKGYGKEQELYDNNLPEGRMYNRTVNIVVETPVE